MTPPEIRTPASLGISAGLREARTDRNVGLRELARRLGFTPSMMSALELGAVAAKPTTVARILGCLQVKGAEFDQLMDFAENAAARNYVDQFTSPTIDLWATYESLSTRVVEWSPFRIPDLLRTPRWLQTMPDGTVVPSEHLDQELFHRQCRQLPIVHGDRQYVFLIGDQALRLVAEEPKRLEQQIGFLLDAGKRKDVTIRILPSLGITSHPTDAFAVFENGTRPVAVTLGHDHCTAYLTDKTLRTSYHRATKVLLRQSSDESATVEAWTASAHGQVL